jgi:hypothetical protein
LARAAPGSWSPQGDAPVRGSRHLPRVSDSCVCVFLSGRAIGARVVAAGSPALGEAPR